MIASIKHEQEDNLILLDELPNSPPPDTGSRALLEKFLDDQSASVSNVQEYTPSQVPITSAPWVQACEPKKEIITSSGPSLIPLNPFSLPSKPIYTLADTPYGDPSSEFPTTTTPARINGEEPDFHHFETADRNLEDQVQSKLLEVVKLLAETQNQSRLPSQNQGYSMEICCNTPSG